jgi:hypothetical protein
MITGVFAAVVLNVPLSLFLLALYRRAVVRAMGAGTGMSPIASVPHADSVASTHSSAALAIDAVDVAASAAVTRAATECSTASIKNTALVYAAAGTLFALVITLGMYLTIDGRFYFVHFLWWVVVNAWPIPLTVGLVTGATGREWVKLVALYMVVFIALSAACLTLYDNLKAGTLGSDALTMLFIAVPVTGLLYRPIRAAGMLVFAFTLTVFAVSPSVVFALMRSFVAGLSGDSLWRAAVLPVALLLGAAGVAILTVLSAVAVTCVLGWWMLRWIGLAYRRKRLSDRSLMLASLWAVVALSHIILLSTQQGGLGGGWSWIAIPIAAFATYSLVERTGLTVLSRRARSRGTAPMLLLLRVFSLRKRSERLFDVLTPRWLQTGSIALIAGPDLATRTIQPNQFLEYLALRIRRQFVKDGPDLSCRLSDLDLQPDPDGRYRVNQFFCFANTWQCAVRELAQRANAVLMDLRGFSASNQGCQYELQQILEHVPVGRCLLTVDGTTDWPFLEATLHRLWAGISRNSPNRAGASSRLRVVILKRATSREVQRVIQLIIGDQLTPAAGEPQSTRR